MVPSLKSWQVRRLIYTVVMMFRWQFGGFFGSKTLSKLCVWYFHLFVLFLLQNSDRQLSMLTLLIVRFALIALVKQLLFDILKIRSFSMFDSLANHRH